MGENKTLKEDIGKVLMGLFEARIDEVVRDGSEILPKLKEIREQDPSRFLSRIQISMYDMCDLVSLSLGYEQKSLGIVHEIVSGNFENFYGKYFRNFEGHSCSSDKSSFVTRKVLEAVKNRENLSLFEDYSKYPHMRGDLSSRAFWSPITIPDTDTALRVYQSWHNMDLKYFLEHLKTVQKVMAEYVAEEKKKLEEKSNSEE